jgi:hypothetical protein
VRVTDFHPPVTPCACRPTTARPCRTPLTGSFELADNTTIRAGAFDPNWRFGVGALWFDARDTAITGATIRVGRERRGHADPGHHDRRCHCGQCGWFVAQTGGTVPISNVTATGVGAPGRYNCPYPAGSPAMTFTGSGNSVGHRCRGGGALEDHLTSTLMELLRCAA